jgi:putative ABC transport system ATP-binding protein
MPIFDLENVRVSRDREDGYGLLIEKFRVSAGDRLAVTGPSGCGKSTTLDLLGMTLKPTAAGRFIFEAGGSVTDVARLWQRGKLDRMADLRRQHIGYVLQTGELLPFLTVRENIELTARLKGAKDAEVRTERLLSELEIAHLARQYPQALSVGERQRAAIGRALAPKPDVILADEPTAALDPALARKVLRLLLESVERDGTALVLVSHDTKLVNEFDFDVRPFDLDTDGGSMTAVLGGAA